MSSTGIKEGYFDYALFYNNFTCLSDINCSGLSVYDSINNLYGLSGTSLLNANSLNVSGTSKLNGATTCISSLNVSGNTSLFNTSINGTLNVSSNSIFRSSIYINGNDNKVFSFDASSSGRLGFLKQAGFGPKICAATGSSIIFSHLSAGDLTQNISGVSVLDRMTINTNGNVGIGVTNPSQQFHVSGITLLNNNTTINGILSVSNSSLLNSVSINNVLFVSGFTTLNNATTINSTLNIIGNIIGSGTALTNINYNAISNPPILSYLPLTGGTLTGQIVINTTNAGVILMNGSGAAFGQASGAGAYSSSAAIGDAIVRSAPSSNLILQAGSGGAGVIINSGNNTTIMGAISCNSTLNVSGNTILRNFTTINSPLYINTNQTTTISALSVNCTSLSILVNIVNNAIWNDGVNYALNVSGYSMFGGIQINGQDTNNIYKRVGNLTIASPSTDSIILKTNSGTWEAMRLNTGGISINTSLYISGLTIINNVTTINSTLYVSGLTTLTGNVTINSNLNIGGQLTLKNNFWHQSADGILRFYYENNGTTYFHSGNTGSDGFRFRNFVQSDILTITDAGNVSITGGMTTSSGYNYLSGLRINGGDTGNTIYQATGNMGINTNTTDINLGMNTYGVKINITPTTTTINNNLITASAATCSSTLNVLGATKLNSTFDVSGSLSVNANNIACVNITIAPATTGTAGYFFINMTNYVNMGGARILLFNCTYAANGWYWMGRLLDNGTGTISNAVDMYSGNLSLATTYTFTGGNYYLKISTSSGLFIGSNDRLIYKLIG